MSLGGNSEDDPSDQPPIGPIDRWESILIAIADDVNHIRQLVTMAWWAGWVILAVVVAVVILID